MKKSLFFFLLIFVLFPTAYSIDIKFSNKYTEVSKDTIENYSAYIIFDKCYEYFDVEKENIPISFGSYKIVTHTSIFHRKIRINKSTAIDEFNKIYLPHIEDKENFKTDFDAITIKKNGEIINVDKSNIRTTTLPANIPFYHKVKGKIDLISLSGITEGDEIEYYYKITSTSKTLNIVPYKFFSLKSVGEKYPIGEYSLQVIADKKINVQTITNNIVEGNYKFSKEKNPESKNTVFKYSINNLKPFIDEMYSIDQNIMPTFYYYINDSRSDNDVITWDIEMNDFLIDAGKSTSINEKLSLGDVIKKMKTKSTLTERLNILSKELNSVYFTDHDYMKLAYNSTYDSKDFGIFQKIADEFDYKLNIWFVKDKNNGRIAKEFPSLQQFDNVYIEFVDQKNNEKIIPPLYRPLDENNQVDYDYINTESLCLTLVKNEMTYKFLNFHPLQKNENTNKVSLINNINISTKNNIEYSINTMKKNYGHFMDNYKFDAYMYTNEKGKNNLRINLIQDILDKSNYIIIDSFYLKPFEVNDTCIFWMYNYKIRTNQPFSGTLITNLNHILIEENNYITNYNQRINDAYIGAPYFKNIEYNLQSSDDDNKILINELFNIDFENEIGTLHAYVSNTNNILKIHIEINRKVSEVKKVDWIKFCEFNNKIEQIYELPIILKKN
jgi:hypothetical protein